MSNEFKIKIIKESIEQRLQEVALYEINIFNYESAIESDDGSDEDKAKFCAHLANLLHSERAEKAKSETILAALRKQLAVLESGA